MENQQQPGQTISPGGAQNQNAGAEPPSNWKFSSSAPALEQPVVSAAGGAPAKQNDPNALSWSASEFVAHNKSAGWYFMLGLAAIILAGLVFLLTRDKISTAAILVAALFFGIFAARRPRTLNYRLDEKGLSIGQKFYSLADFKSFSVIQEGAFSGIVLMPLKRFMPSLEIYYDPKDQERIANLLSGMLPFEERKADPIDKFVKRIRF